MLVTTQSNAPLLHVMVPESLNSRRVEVNIIHEKKYDHFLLIKFLLRQVQKLQDFVLWKRFLYTIE